MTSFRSPKNPKNSIFSRLNYLSKKMSNPKTTAKEMKVLKLREKNLMEMMEDGMEEGRRRREEGTLTRNSGRGNRASSVASWSSPSLQGGTREAPRRHQ